MIFSDLKLSRRLELAEAKANAQFVEARRRLRPESGAEWIEVAGAYAMYDGPESPCTQTFGLGLFDAVTDEHWRRIESFFEDRGAPVFHEISPIADAALLPELHRRGYAPVELTAMLFQELAGRTPLPISPEIEIVRVKTAEDREAFSRTGAAGWADTVGFADLIAELSHVIASRESEVSLLAMYKGQPIATGSLSLQDGVALLAGASTVPQFRRLGAQQALLEARLRYAADHGCDIATMSAQPVGGPSQRNAERKGFRIAYTRIKWRKCAHPA